MTDTTQPTPIDADLYERLKKHTQNEHGQVRGSLRDELETAIKNHLEADNPTNPIARIENDVATIKAQLAEQDGGEGIPEGGAAPSPSTSDTHTHTDDAVDPDFEDEMGRVEAGHPANQDDERHTTDTQDDQGNDSDTLSKPGAKATKKAKAEYVFNELESGGDVFVPPAVLERKVDKIWGFGDRATSDIIERIFHTYNGEAVSVDGSTWRVALGKTEQARDDRIDDLVDGTEDVTHEDLTFVSENEFEGFDRDGTPTGIRKR